MIEDEILSVLSQAKQIYKTHDATARVLGVKKSTFHSWLKQGKGIKSHPLFKVLDILGIHLRADPKSEISLPQEEGQVVSISCQSSSASSGTMRIEILKAKNESLEDKVKLLSAHNESLQEQVTALTSLLLSKSSNKKEASNLETTNGITKVS